MITQRPKEFGLFETFAYKEWKLSNLSDTAIRVLEVILIHMDFKEGISFPTQDTICKESGIVTLATVSRAVKELVAKGVIEVSKRKGVYRHYPYNLYTILIYVDGKIVPPHIKLAREETVSLLGKEEVDDIIRRSILIPEPKPDRVED